MSAKTLTSSTRANVNRHAWRQKKIWRNRFDLVETTIVRADLRTIINCERPYIYAFLGVSANRSRRPSVFTEYSTRWVHAKRRKDYIVVAVQLSNNQSNGFGLWERPGRTYDHISQERAVVVFNHRIRARASYVEDHRQGRTFIVRHPAASSCDHLPVHLRSASKQRAGRERGMYSVACDKAHHKNASKYHDRVVLDSFLQRGHSSL